MILDHIQTASRSRWKEGKQQDRGRCSR